MLIVVLVLFFLFMTPKSVWNFLDIFLVGRGKINLTSNWIRSIRTWVREWAFLNSYVNAFVYATSSR